MCAHPCEGAAHVGCPPCTALCKAPATRSGQLRSAGLQVLTGRDLPAAIRQKAIPRGVPTFETCKTPLSHCSLCRCL